MRGVLEKVRVGEWRVTGQEVRGVQEGCERV